MTKVKSRSTRTSGAVTAKPVTKTIIMKEGHDCFRLCTSCRHVTPHNVIRWDARRFEPKKARCMLCGLQMERRLCRTCNSDFWERANNETLRQKRGRGILLPMPEVGGNRCNRCRDARRLGYWCPGSDCLLRASGPSADLYFSLECPTAKAESSCLKYDIVYYAEQFEAMTAPTSIPPTESSGIFSHAELSPSWAPLTHRRATGELTLVLEEAFAAGTGGENWEKKNTNIQQMQGVVEMDPFVEGCSVIGFSFREGCCTFFSAGEKCGFNCDYNGRVAQCTLLSNHGIVHDRNVDEREDGDEVHNTMGVLSLRVVSNRMAVRWCPDRELASEEERITAEGRVDLQTASELMAEYDDVTSSWLCRKLLLPDLVAHRVKQFLVPPPVFFFEAGDLWMEVLWRRQESCSLSSWSLTSKIAARFRCGSHE